MNLFHTALNAENANRDFRAALAANADVRSIVIVAEAGDGSL